VNKIKNNRKKLGLALGSGGARGLAHIGVIKVLKENNIPIDYIVGSSMGAIIGAYYALNLEIDSLEKKALQLTKRDLVKLIDITSPKRALIAGNKVKNFIKNLIEDKSFSDTKIPLKIIATDLESGEEVIISRGKLIDAIRASISIPVLFPPIRLHKRLLVDGGIVNATPVDIVKEMGADIVIGVDLTIKGKVKLENPTIVETLMQSYEIYRTQSVKSNLYKVNKNLVVIKPNVAGKLNSFKFYNTQRFIDKGEGVTKKALPKIKRLLKI